MMGHPSTARIIWRCPALSWLTDPACAVPEGARPLLLGQLVSSPMAVVMGAFNGVVVAGVCLLRQEVPLFSLFLALELLILFGRLTVIRGIQRSRAAGLRPRIEGAILLSLLWCALQGSMSFAAMRSGDATLMILSASLIMAVVGSVCARNFSAPRLAMLLVALCVLPFVTGAALSGDPWLLLLPVMAVPFFLGTWQIIWTFQHTLVGSLAAEARSSHLAQHDRLTGLLNRFGLEAAFGARMDGASRLATLYLDLDGFKPINDTHGHDVGDKLLVEVAARLSRNLRPADLVARTGGDEFVVVIRDMEPEAVQQVAERLVSAIADRPYDVEGMLLRVGVSLGWACIPEDAATLEEARLRADAALYAAKQGGRGIGRRFDDPALSRA
ncbi:diguanylate cyclase [Roseomonas sp. KE0001]|uniref:GGDEF domain-containing protein n=1 Tax=unclassified Roseomonas TaxID=2617492 RepID=UPI0018DFBED9|nr:GGDEF domain-containing protein [Roseomonas sp. KE0001]MBI0434243.1 GGDEF domain-containing protein [Roseomonas sp. KE0001]